MLRGAKQLGTLSQSARSLLLSGPRCSAADGSSATCSEDDTFISRRSEKKHDTCISRRPQKEIELLHSDISTTAGSRPSVAVGSLISVDPGKALNSLKQDTVGPPVSLPKVITASCSGGGAECVSYASVDQTTEIHQSHPIDQFVKAGAAAASLLSDFVNCNLFTADGSAYHGAPAVQRKTAHTAKSAECSRNTRGVIIHGKSHPEAAVGSSATNSSPATKNNSNTFTPAKGNANLSNNGSRNSVSDSRYSDSSDRKGPIPEKSRNYSNYSTSNGRKGDVKNVGDNTEGFTRPVRETKLSNGVTPLARQFSGYSHLVDSVSHILQQLKWGPATEDALRKLNYSLDAFQANQVLKKLQDYPVALGFFYWLKRQPGFRHDGHTYTTMVGILGRARQFGAINKLLDQMFKEGCPPNVVTYNRIIHSYGRANYLNDALHVFHQMQKVGCEPDRVTYCTLIDLHAKAGYLDIAMEMYQRMQEVGLTPDTFTYSVIINCLGKAGHLAAAHKLFTEMVNQGCIPNLVTYNIMIDLHAKARNYQNALQLYHDMQNAGFEPDKVTYSIVMEVLGHCGYLDEMEAVFAEMKMKNWVPDEPVYGLLVDLWGKSGNVEKAWSWYLSMLNAGLRPNVPTCNSLLSAFLRVHRLSDAYNLLQSMLNLGLRPTLQTYTLLLSCCTEAKTSYDMGFCCELMAVTGHPAHIFLLSMPSCGPDGQNVRDHASNFLDFMHSENRESKRGLVDAVVDFLHKTGLKEEAGSIWEVAAQKNIYPDAVREKSSCYWLINLHVMSDGTAVTALSRTLARFRRQMLDSGVCPSRIDIVTGWGRRSRVTGSSLVRHAVYELLNMFSFPFLTENGNSGCFVGCGEALNRWLLHSYVERMHLL